MPTLTNQILEAESSRSSATQEIPRIMEPKVSLSCSQERIFRLYPEPDESTSQPPTLFCNPLRS
jgi:hypothetical protein